MRYILLSIFFLLVIVSGVVGYLYFTKSSPKVSLPNLPLISKQYDKVEAVSAIEGYVLELNNPKYLQEYVENLGFYSLTGYTIPGGENLPDYVPKESITNTIEKIKVVIGLDKSAVAENAIIMGNKFPIFVTAGFSSNIFMIQMSFYKTVIDKVEAERISLSELNLRLNTELLWHLAKLSKRYDPNRLDQVYAEKEAEVKVLADKQQLPILLVKETRE